MCRQSVARCCPWFELRAPRVPDSTVFQSRNVSQCARATACEKRRAATKHCVVCILCVTKRRMKTMPRSRHRGKQRLGQKRRRATATHLVQRPKVDGVLTRLRGGNVVLAQHTHASWAGGVAFIMRQRSAGRQVPVFLCRSFHRAAASHSGFDESVTRCATHISIGARQGSSPGDDVLGRRIRRRCCAAAAAAACRSGTSHYDRRCGGGHLLYSSSYNILVMCVSKLCMMMMSCRGCFQAQFFWRHR